MKKNLLIYFFYIVLVFTWGSSFILMKYGLLYYTPAQVATIRQVSALAVLGAFAVVYVQRLPRNKIKYAVASGLLSMFIPAYLFCYAEAGMSSAIAGILNALTPAFTLIIGITFYKETLHKLHIAGLLVGFAGICFIILFNSTGNISINHFAFFVIAATICYGLNINMVKKYLHNENPIHVTTVAVASAGIAAITFILATNGLPQMVINNKNCIPLIASVTLGVFGTAIAQLLFYQLIKTSSALFASTVTYMLPIVAIFWGVLNGEHLVVWHYVGMAFIIIGIIIIRQPVTTQKNT